MALLLAGSLPSGGGASAGTLVTIYDFGGIGTTDGSAPHATLIAGRHGRFYGTTPEGGANGAGTVFTVTQSGAETVLYDFCGQPNCTDGAAPYAGLAMDAAGNLYGATISGGANAAGAVFELTPAGVETVLYSFCSQPGCADGKQPEGTLIIDQTGNLYGTTFAGGAAGQGTVFQLAPDGTETVLYSFCASAGCADGAQPYAGVTRDRQGNLFGTTTAGGANGRGGTVFELTPTGTLTVLYSFCSQSACADGAYPQAGVILDKSGNLFGTTLHGGRKVASATTGGTAFKLAADGSETVLYAFCAQPNCADGAYPEAGLVRDSRGNLYGTASHGGAADLGAVFKLRPGGAQTLLYSFCALTACSDGGAPEGGLILHAGSLFGTTSELGAGAAGTVFMLTP